MHLRFYSGTNGDRVCGRQRNFPDCLCVTDLPDLCVTDLPECNDRSSPSEDGWNIQWLSAFVEAREL